MDPSAIYPIRAAMKRIAILGSTGSVGVNALRLIAERPERFAVACLCAHQSLDALVEQVARFRPAAASLTRGDNPPSGWPDQVAWFTGADSEVEALQACQPDLVLNAITGAAGLRASEWTLRQGLPLALANKESMVMAGPYLMELAREFGATILPVDSEHCAIFQCLRGERMAEVRKIYLTASGGPFRDHPLEDFASISPEQALRHPTWDMGPRITIGSATMMNKAFEVLEAHWLFGLDSEQIEVLIHPQSIVHSMVEFVDGNMLAQLGVPDMRVPILYCLSYPDRTPFAFEPFDPARFSQLTFEPVDATRFPSVPLAYTTLQRGGTAGAVLNAADEVMTNLFLQGAATFPEITATVADVLQSTPATEISQLEQVLNADRDARQTTLGLAQPR